MSNWNKAIDQLFESGSSVSFASLCQASKTALDEKYEAERNKKYGTERLEVERVSSRSPIETVKATPYPLKHETERLAELKLKFRVQGLELEGDKPKEAKAWLEALGSDKSSIVESIRFAAQCGVRW